MEDGLDPDVLFLFGSFRLDVDGLSCDVLLCREDDDPSSSMRENDNGDFLCQPAKRCLDVLIYVYLE